MISNIWVFVADGASLPSGVFREKSLASEWIQKRFLSGILTEYPLDVGVYEWAIDNGLFTVKYPSQEEASFIGRFTSAYLKHSHFENGEELS
jgi:hypothetical protein